MGFLLKASIPVEEGSNAEKKGRLANTIASRERWIKMKPMILAILFFLAGLSSPALAVKANMSSTQLRQTATHVIVGTVVGVYHRERSIPPHRVTDYVAEIRVQGVEKGQGLKPGDLLYARYYTQVWMGPGQPVPGDSGHRGLPREGETLRVYLARNAYDGGGYTQDGGFNVILANGFERLGKTRKP